MTLAISPHLDHDLWLKARLKSIGASEAGSVLGVPDAYETPLQVWGRKVGRLPMSSEPTQAMEWGNRLEPVIAKAYEEKSGNKLIKQQLFLSSGHLSATLDGIDDTNTIVEFKSISERRAAQVLGDEDTQDIPLTWILQAHQQMYCARESGLEDHGTDGDCVTFAVLVGGNQYRTYSVPWNQRLWNNAQPRMDAFWNEYVIPKIAPPIAGSSDAQALTKIYGQTIGTIYLNDEVAQAAERWEDLGRQVSELNKLRDADKARLLEAMTDHQIGVLPNGRKLKRSVCIRKEYTVAPTQYINISLSRS